MQFIAVCQEMLHKGRGLPIFRVIALQALDKTNNKRSIQIRVFPVALLGPSPAGVPSNVGVRGPYDQIALIIVMILVARFISFNRGRLLQNRGVPCFT